MGWELVYHRRDKHSAHVTCAECHHAWPGGVSAKQCPECDGIKLIKRDDEMWKDGDIIAGSPEGHNWSEQESKRVVALSDAEWDKLKIQHNEPDDNELLAILCSPQTQLLSDVSKPVTVIKSRTSTRVDTGLLLGSKPVINAADLITKNSLQVNNGN